VGFQVVILFNHVLTFTPQILEKKVRIHSPIMIPAFFPLLSEFSWKLSEALAAADVRVAMLIHWEIL
jgi:hypothetical protein